MLIDVGTEAKRAAIAAIVGDWIAGCAAAGFDAVEIDNLDSFSRSGGRLAQDDAIAAMKLRCGQGLTSRAPHCTTRG